MRRLIGLAAMAVTTPLACGDDEPAGPQEERFRPTSSGGDEVPPVTTEATSTATFTIRGDSLFCELTVSNITGVTASHIHGPAEPGVNAGVLLLLYSSQGPTGPINGTLGGGERTRHLFPKLLLLGMGMTHRKSRVSRDQEALALGGEDVRHRRG